jgi:adenine-specific DNA methylase
MAHDDPSTLDLFGNTALTSSFSLGVTAFAPAFGDGTDDDPPPVPSPALPTPTMPKATTAMQPKIDFRLVGSRTLSRTWRERARDNIAAIQMAAEIERRDRPARPDEQAKLIRFTGFGASDLANGMFRRPSSQEFREGWNELADELESSVSTADYASLARCTQYAHFTLELIVRAIWSALVRFGFSGGRILEPGIGTGMFPALMPHTLSRTSHITGIELDPVTARIVRLLQPRAKIITADFARTQLPDHFDLAIGNPPFSDRTVRSDPAFRTHGFRLHDYFIAKAIDQLKPGGLAAFVTSAGTMDKADSRAREHIAGMANLVGAIRLPEKSFRADAGTDVVVDILFFRKRREDEPVGDHAWLDLSEVGPANDGEPAIRINRWFVDHPGMVLGKHAIVTGQYGETYTCPQLGSDLETALSAAIERLPADIYDGEPASVDFELKVADAMAERPDDPRVREGSYFIGKGTALMQVVDGLAAPVEVKKGRAAHGVFAKHARIIRKLIPIRDAVRSVLKLQERDQPWKQAQVSLRIAWSSFVREFGPINFTTVSTSEDPETGEICETHRRPNLQPFLDDPDCWLVASIEDYDHPRWRDRAPDPQHGGDGSGQGKARQDQGRLPVVDLVGPRPH